MRDIYWKWRKARIWWNKLPDWTYPIDRTIESSVTFNGLVEKHVITPQVGLEWLMPIGGRAYYGAIGASFTPLPMSSLQIRVAVTNGEGVFVRNTLADRIDDTYQGFPYEYADRLLTDLVKFRFLQEIGTVNLTIDHAIHGLVGSSSAFFRVISYSVIRFLSMDVSSLSDDDIVSILENNYRAYFRS